MFHAFGTSRWSRELRLRLDWSYLVLFMKLETPSPNDKLSHTQGCPELQRVHLLVSLADTGMSELCHLRRLEDS
jgi:hypothetical protein